jgi:hypothetical protein
MWGVCIYLIFVEYWAVVNGYKYTIMYTYNMHYKVVTYSYKIKIKRLLALIVGIVPNG